MKAKMQIRLDADRQPAAPTNNTSSSSDKGIVGGTKDDKYRFTVLAPGIIRIEWSPDSIFEDRPSSFAIHRSTVSIPDYTVKDTDFGLEISTSRVKLTYNKSSFEGFGFFATASGATWRWGDDNGSNLGGTIRTLDMMDGQKLMRAGTFVPLEDGILSKSGFTLLDDSKSMLFDSDNHFIASRRPGDDRIDCYLFAYGRDYRTAIKDFYRLSGPVPLLPRWSLGNWWSRYYDYTTETYLTLMDRFRSSGIPLSVAVIDMGWHLVKEKQVVESGASGWTGYTWNRDLFPDPPAFLSELHKRGLKTTLNDHPAEGIASYEDKYEEVAKFLNHDTSQGAAVPFDATSKKYLKAYFDIVLAGLEKDGCDFWWIDWQQGSYSRLKDVDPLWVLNHYHFLHAQGRSDVKHPIIFSRYGGPGSHRYPIGFSGDTFTTWDSLDFQPRFTATASNIGYGWWSHDIGGHQFGVRDDDLTVRWVQLGVLSPIMRLHSTQNKWVTKEPWNLPAATNEILTRWLRLRHQLIPYLYTMNVRAATKGEPLVQPMYWAYPHDEVAYSYKNQFLFGSQLLVAPITSPQARGAQLGRVEGWLPAGIWVDFFSGVVYRGDRELSFSRPIDRYPVFMKQGAIVPLDAADEPDNGGGNPSAFVLVLVVGADGHFDILEDPADGDKQSRNAARGDDGDGTDCFPISYTQSSGQLNIGALDSSTSSSTLKPSSRSWTIRFVGLDSSSSPTVHVNDEAIDVETSHDSSSVIVPVGDVPVNFAATVTLGDDPQLRKNDPAAMIEPVIKDAQVLYDDKDKLWGAVTKDESMALKVNKIRALEVDEGLKQFALECLLADQE